MRSSKAGALGTGGARAVARVWAGRIHLTVNCSVFLGRSFRDGNICEWKRVKALEVGAILLDFHIFGRDIKAKIAGVCPRLLSLSTPLNLKKKKPSHI